MLADAVGFLACPHCAGDLGIAERSLVCARGHTFDVARQGYVSLLSGDARTGTADTPAMVESRDAFLRAGHFRVIADAVADAVGRWAPDPTHGCIVELGAGTGYYLAHTLDRLPGVVGLALDVSKPALRRAARAHERLSAVACDVWRDLPVRTGSVRAVLDVFAPRNAVEVARVLGPEGAFVVVTPTSAHLSELVSALGLLNVDERKSERLVDALGTAFKRVEHATVEDALQLSRADVTAAASMGPSAWHMDTVALVERNERLSDAVDVTLSVNVDVFRKVAG